MTMKITTTPTPLEVVDTINSIIDDKLDKTGTAASASTLTGLTATVAELNKLDGVTATTAELNYVDGVTGNIQEQLDSKFGNTDIVPIANGGTGAIPFVQDVALVDKELNFILSNASTKNISLPGVDTSDLEMVLYTVDTVRSIAKFKWLTVESYTELLNRPIWATTLGDGSDGTFAPTADVTLAQGEYNYTSVNIPSGVTVTITKNVIIHCQGEFANAGTISGVGTGGEGGAKGTSSSYLGEDGETGLVAGGAGGTGKATSSGGNSSTKGGLGAQFDNCDPYVIDTLYGGGGGGGGYGYYGSNNGGGDGGNGGAGLIVIAKSITHTGAIDLSGNDGDNSTNTTRSGGGGGGAGGSAFFVSDSITNTGTFTATGGAYGSGYNWSSPYPASNGGDGALYSYESTYKGVWA